jgi:hypothetical protein
MSYEAFLTVVLTAVAVILAALAIIIAIAAVWGYQSIAGEATKRAESAAGKKLDEYFASEEISVKLKAAIESRLTLEADQLYQDLVLGGADVSARAPEGTQPIADAYPEEGGK